MRLSTLKASMMLLVGFALIAMSTRGVATAPPPILPNPVLNFLGQEPFKIGGKDYIRYNYEVSNREVYPNELFAAAPELPPCGANKKSSRTWVDVLDSRGKRLQGFCAFGNSNDLRSFWFAMESEIIPPSYVYIEMDDRKTNTKYKSNLADTTQ
jgi:hypothetical protein